jgi:dTDP-4-dehydrorhamnose reductase
MKKIFMAGAGGMLGEAFHVEFQKKFEIKCTDIDVNESWLGRSDFRNFSEYRQHVKEMKPDYLFHLGAFTDLEYCETHPDETYATNTLSVENAVYIANELEIPLLYISTAGIFDGKKELYDDWDTPNPLGVYARSKYQGELFVQQNADRHLICRAGWMMGGGPKKDKKFVQKLMKKIKSGERELFIVNDKLGVPTYTHDFAKNVGVLLEKEYWGLYNMVCDGMTGRLEVARELVKLLGLESRLKITEVTSEHFSKEFFAPRPDSERLLNKKLNLRGLNTMRDWKLSLKEYLARDYANYL